MIWIVLGCSHMWNKIKCCKNLQQLAKICAKTCSAALKMPCNNMSMRKQYDRQWAGLFMLSSYSRLDESRNSDYDVMDYATTPQPGLPYEYLATCLSLTWLAAQQYANDKNVQKLVKVFANSLHLFAAFYFILRVRAALGSVLTDLISSELNWNELDRVWYSVQLRWDKWDENMALGRLYST